MGNCFSFREKGSRGQKPAMAKSPQSWPVTPPPSLAPPEASRAVLPPAPSTTKETQPPPPSDMMTATESTQPAGKKSTAPCGAKLQFHLDEDRSGAGVDATAAACQHWLWDSEVKPDKKEEVAEVTEPVAEKKDAVPKNLGAIIMKATRSKDYYEKQGRVEERTPLLLKWKPDKTPAKGCAWDAILSFSLCNEQGHPAKDAHLPDQAVLLYKTPSFDKQEEALKGGGENLYNNEWVRSALEEKGQCPLWMEAADFPRAPDACCVKIELTGDNVVDKKQWAVVRIAPWIMTSDLIETQYVCAVQSEKSEKKEQDAWSKISDFATDDHFIKLWCNPAAKKPFSRDIFKSGYVASPANCVRVLVTDLDQALDIRDPVAAVKKARTDMKHIEDTGNSSGKDIGYIRYILGKHIQEIGAISGKDIQGGGTFGSSQTHGGNYLVTPPNDEYPLGRIVYGEDPKDGKLTCGIADFIWAQQVQKPVILNPTWLSVGHVDELVAFVPITQKKFKVLISSPVLAYVLMHKIANNSNKPLADIIKESQQEFASLYGDRTLLTYDQLKKGLAYFPESKIEQEPVPEEKESKEIQESKKEIRLEYLHQASSYLDLCGPPPEDANRTFLVPHPHPRPPTEAMSADAMRLDAKPPRSNVLTEEKFNIACYVQSRIDQGCRVKLASELKLEKGDFIDLPVAFFKLDDAETGDSTNMLILKADKGYKCLIAKPYGPVLAKTYVFEEYIKKQLRELNIESKNIVFVSNWYEMHRNTGEIHCGTNQIPDLSKLQPSQIKWWEQKPVTWRVGELKAPALPELPDELLPMKELWWNDIRLSFVADPRYEVIPKVSMAQISYDVVPGERMRDRREGPTGKYFDGALKVKTDAQFLRGGSLPGKLMAARKEDRVQNIELVALQDIKTGKWIKEKLEEQVVCECKVVGEKLAWKTVVVKVTRGEPEEGWSLTIEKESVNAQVRVPEGYRKKEYGVCLAPWTAGIPPVGGRYTVASVLEELKSLNAEVKDCKPSGIESSAVVATFDKPKEEAKAKVALSACKKCSTCRGWSPSRTKRFQCECGHARFDHNIQE